MKNPWLRAFVIDWLIILAAYNLLWLPLALIVIGTRIHALAILAHDGAHFNAPSEWFARLAFNLIGVNLKKYRTFHFGHHFDLGTHRDPELRVHTHHWDAFSWRCVAKDLCGLSTFEMLRIWRFAGGEYWRIGATLGLFALFSPLFALLWAMALGTVFMTCFRQRAIIEHGHAYQIKPWMRLILFPHNCEHHEKHHANPALSFDKLSNHSSGTQ